MEDSIGMGGGSLHEEDDEDIEHSSEEESEGDEFAKPTSSVSKMQSQMQSSSRSRAMDEDDWVSQGKSNSKIGANNVSRSYNFGSKIDESEDANKGKFHSRAAEAHRERRRIMEIERQRREQDTERYDGRERRMDNDSDSEEKSYDSRSDDYEDIDDDDDYDELDDGGSEQSDEGEDPRQVQEDMRRRRAQDRQSTARDDYAAEYRPARAENKHGHTGGKTKRGTGAKGVSSDSKMDEKSSSAASSTVPFTETHGKIRPGREGLFNYTEILSSTYRELKNFLLKPVARGYVTRCYIERHRTGKNYFAPFYSLCADLDDGTGRELIVCKKLFKSGFATSHYVFSLKTEDLDRTRERRSRLFVGKLRQSSTGESYVLYDNGAQAAPGGEDGGDEDYEDDDEYSAQPKASSSSNSSASAKGTNDDSSLYRKEHAIINFSSFERPTPQKGMEICIPNPTTLPGAEGEIKEQVGTKRSMIRRFEVMRRDGKQNGLYTKSLFVLHEKQSRYDPLSSCLVDFKGRANMASRRNFQLVQSIADGKPPSNRTSGAPPPQQDSEFILQMGKTTEECYNMDVKYPLSVFQAFAICISRFDAKLKKNNS